MGTQVPNGDPSAIPVPVADGGTGATTAQAAAAALGLINWTFPAVVGTRWTEIGLQGGLLLADHDLADVADVTASPGDGTVANGSEFADLSIASTTLTAQSTTDPDTGATWYTDNANYSWFLDEGPGELVFETHIAVDDASVGRNIMQLYVMDATNLGGFSMQFDVNPGGSDVVQAQDFLTGNATNNLHVVSGVSDATLETGYWVRMWKRPSGEMRVVYAAAAIGARPSSPSDWTFGSQSTRANLLTPGQQIRCGFGLRYISGQTVFKIGALRIGNARISAQS